MQGEGSKEKQKQNPGARSRIREDKNTEDRIRSKVKVSSQRRLMTLRRNDAKTKRTILDSRRKDLQRLKDIDNH